MLRFLLLRCFFCEESCRMNKFSYCIAYNYLLCVLECSNDVVFYLFTMCGFYFASPILILKHRKGFLEVGKICRYCNMLMFTVSYQYIHPSFVCRLNDNTTESYWSLLILLRCTTFRLP